MSDSIPNPKLRQRWLQFSMRSVLLWTVVAAVAAAWFIAPEDRFRELGKRGAKVCEEFVREIDPNTKQGVPVLNGRWELMDEHGLARIEGRIDRGVPTGRWTMFDADGNALLDGHVQSGLRVGEWVEWHDAHQQRSRANYELLAREVAEDRPDYPVSRLRRWASNRSRSGIASVRTGKWTAWRANGAEQARGEYAPNAAPITAAALTPDSPPPVLHDYRLLAPAPELELATGEWATFDDQRSVVTQGKYQAGLRTGAWRVAGTNVDFVAGQPVADVDAELERLASSLDAPTFVERHRTVWKLRQLGDASLPRLLAWLEGDHPERKWMAAGALTHFAGQNVNVLEALAEAAADPANPRDLRLAILKSFPKIGARSTVSASKLTPLAAPENDDLELRSEARLARMQLSAECFPDIAKQLLSELASDDQQVRYSATETMNSAYRQIDKASFSEVLRRLNRSERLAVTQALKREFAPNNQWGSDWQIAGDLLPVLKKDSDLTIREMAANLRLPDATDRVGGMGGKGSTFGRGSGRSSCF